jgi:hypothetical protein
MHPLRVFCQTRYNPHCPIVKLYLSFCQLMYEHVKCQRIMPLSFFGKESLEPGVIGWITSAAIIYFLDPDDHI